MLSTRGEASLSVAGVRSRTRRRLPRLEVVLVETIAGHTAGAANELRVGIAEVDVETVQCDCDQ